LSAGRKKVLEPDGSKVLNRSMNKSCFLLAGLLLLLCAPLNAAEDRRERVLNDRKEVTAAGAWIYNDLPAAIAKAGRTGKPLLVVLRCVP
jgi:serine protease Do